MMMKDYYHLAKVKSYLYGTSVGKICNEKFVQHVKAKN